MFGPEFEQIWPKAGSTMKLTDFGRKMLKKCQDIKKPDMNKINIKDFIKKSSNFPVEFGTNTCRIISQPKERYPIIEKQIASAYPIIHERVLGLYLAYMEHICQYGNSIQQRIYTKLNLIGFVQRLLEKRAVSFVGPYDYYSLLSGENGAGGFKEIGTEDESKPLIMKNTLTYDEIKLSALLSVSSYSEFLNDGNRFNVGNLLEDKSKIEPEGLVVGITGGRFEVPEVMEWEDIMITQSQNTLGRGYGNTDKPQTRDSAYRRLWQEFYEEPDYTYETAIKSTNTLRFSKFDKKSDLFDNLLMKKRYTISFDTFLLESEARAKEANKQAYIHVVGIGLGVWKAAEHQNQIFLETFAQRLKALMPHLSHISVVHFSWFHMTECGELKNDGIFKHAEHPKGGIRTFLSNRNPADRLPAEYANSLLVVSYAWDGNALPGNEFWRGNLFSSGDSSTACSTLISELQNPHINDQYINGNNLHIATENNGVQHIGDYTRQMLHVTRASTSHYKFA